jgi:excisionase family DNA binding protein
MGELLTTEEVAQILGIRPQSLAVWRLHKRELPFIHVGRLVRYKKKDVEAWLDRQTVAVGEG